MTGEVKSTLELVLERSQLKEGRSDLDILRAKLPEMVFLPDAIKELEESLGIVHIGSLPDKSQIPDEQKIKYGMLIALKAANEAYQRRLRREQIFNRRDGQYL